MNKVSITKSFTDRYGNIHMKPTDKPIVERTGVFGVFIRQQNILSVLPSYSKGYWELPGGGIDEGETPEQALKREIKEESNLSDIEIIKQISSDTFNFYADDVDQYWKYNYNMFEVNSGKYDSIAPRNEIAEVYFMPMKAMQENFNAVHYNILKNRLLYNE